MEKLYGYGGWVRFREPSAAHSTYLRFRADGTLAELHVSAGSRDVTPGLLRGIPLARYRASARARPDLLFGAGMFHHPVTDLTASLDEAAFPHGQPSGPERRFRLKPPSEIVLTDGFLRDVARAYEDAVAHGESPNITLSSQSGHPRRTIERWVYVARKRGFLAPVRRGDS